MLQETRFPAISLYNLHSVHWKGDIISVSGRYLECQRDIMSIVGGGRGGRVLSSLERHNECIKRIS